MPVATSAQTAGTARSGRPFDLEPLRASDRGIQADAEISRSDVGQRMSTHVPSTYVPFADWNR